MKDDFKIGDYVYSKDGWMAGTIVRIDGDTADVEFETAGGGGCLPFLLSELRHKEKYYYKLTNSKTGDELFAEGDKLVSEAALLEMMGLEDYTAEIITREEYEEEMYGLVRQ